jgi:hypothetical protein
MGWHGPVTLRQYMVWMAWLDEDYNHPTRTDFYLMQVALDAIRPWTKAKLKLSDFQLEFGKSERRAIHRPSAEEIEANKQRWMNALGGNDPSDFAVRLPDGTVQMPRKK